MKIEKQVLNIDQMKHLQELGVDTSDASMCWLDFEDNDSMEVAVFNSDFKFGHPMCKVYPTYTIGDLIEKLPKKFDFGYEEYKLSILIMGEYIEVQYTDGSDYTPLYYSQLTLLRLLYRHYVK